MSSSNQSPASPDPQIEGEKESANMPMTMAASVVLEQLPKDAHKALETAGDLEKEKGMSGISICQTVTHFDS